jgi:ubiquinone/menaquinone biosynthesis C-methylase UbiE
VGGQGSDLIDETSSAAGADAFPIGNHYDKEAATHPLEKRLVAGFTAALEDLLPASAESVLEVGCGEGHQLQKVLASVGARRVVGLDLLDVELEGSWTGLTGVDLLWGSAYQLPFPSDSFDLVLALEMLEHVDEPDTVLAEIARVATGPVVISVPWEPVWRLGNLARRRYVRELGNTPGHIQHYSRRAIVQRIERHLDVVAVRKPFPWTFVLAQAR